MTDHEDRPQKTLGDLHEHFRIQRHQEYLDTAQRIVTKEGVVALTMQRLADELSCSVGSIYRYFPSKNALLGELQRTALEVLLTSLQLTLAHLDDLLAAGEHDKMDVSLTRVVCAARFWIEAEQTFPNEVEVSRLMFTDPSVHFSEEDGARVLPAAFRMLAAASTLMDDAVSAGSIRPGISVDRAMIIIAGTTGVLLTSGLARWDDQLLDGRRLASTLLETLFFGWGAEPERLQRALSTLDELVRLGHLAGQQV